MINWNVGTLGLHALIFVENTELLTVCVCGEILLHDTLPRIYCFLYGVHQNTKHEKAVELCY